MQQEAFNPFQWIAHHITPLLPKRCLACETPLFLKSRAHHGLNTCPACTQALLQQATHRCQQCGLKLGPRLQAFGWTHCRHCRADPKNIRTVVCCDYETPAKHWITQLKYHQQPQYARFVGQWLAHTLTHTRIEKPHVLVPVPTSPDRQTLRGYNQAELIANVVSKYTGIPVNTSLLVRLEASRSQAGSNRQTRQQNDHQFRCTQSISNTLRIGLVDDVITTGATLQACTQAFEKAGAQQFIHLAICRTPE